MEIETYLHSNDWIAPVYKGHSNGYISLPKDHPWYGKDYNNIHEEYPDLSVHGGLTYSKDHKPNHPPDGLWWIGFDTLHLDDSPTTCDETYCRKEVEELKRQALEVINA